MTVRSRWPALGIAALACIFAFGGVGAAQTEPIGTSASPSVGDAPPPSPSPDAGRTAETPPNSMGESLRPYVDEQRGFSFLVPASWRPLTQDELDRLFNAQLPLDQQHRKFLAGFTPAAQGIAYPYVLVQLMGERPLIATWEEIEASYEVQRVGQAASEHARSLSDVLGDVRVNQPFVDRARARVIIMLEAEVEPDANNASQNIAGTNDAAQETSEGQSGDADIQPPALRALTLVQLGRDTQVALHAYERASSFEETRPLLEQIGDSFAWREGLAFQASNARGPDASSGNGKRSVSPWILVAFLASGVLVAALLVVGMIVIVKINKLRYDSQRQQNKRP
ncbi:MAG: hypothetical protein SFZ23_04130 [Planctomycetota bacterium]|nr:hypothetical protein [Planctomycetota bacterium]